MKLVKKRRLAVIIAVVIVLLSTLFGVHRSLIELSYKVEELFYTGVDKSGIGIDDDLLKRLEYSYNLVSYARKYGGCETEADAVLSAREQLSAANSPGAKYSANSELTNTALALYDKLNEGSLSEKDFTYVKSQYNNLLSRNDTIAHEAGLYNQKVREFNNDTLGEFPINFLRYPAFIVELETYG